MSAIISAQNLTKTIDFEESKITILHPTSLEVQAGEIHAIQGKSGSGKSTLLNILGTLDQQSRGTYRYKKTLIDRLPQEELLHHRRNFGFIFQQYFLIKHLTLYDNIMLPAYYSGKIHSVATKKHAEQLLDLLEIKNIQDKKPHQISGGQQQRTAIARALINQPEILFADEPTGALDSSNTENVMTIFKDINQNFHTTIIMVTHDQDIASYADNITHIYGSEKRQPLLTKHDTV